MKRAREVSNVHGEVHFKQKQRLTIVFTGNTLLHRKNSFEDAEDFIVGKIACHQHATVPKMNSTTAPPRYHNKAKKEKKRFTKTKICMEVPLNRNSLRIEAKKKKENIYIYIYIYINK